MDPVSIIRFYSEKDYQSCEALIDRHLKRNPNWQVVSVSHVLIPNGVSVACVLQYIGPRGHSIVMPSSIE